MLHCPSCLAENIHSPLDIDIIKITGSTEVRRIENEKLNCPEMVLKSLDGTATYKLEISCPKRCSSSFYKLKTGAYVVPNPDGTFSAYFPNYAESVTDEMRFKANRQKWIKPSAVNNESWKRQSAWNFGTHRAPVEPRNFDLVRYEEAQPDDQIETVETVDDYGYYY